MNDSQQIDADRRASTTLGLRYGRIAGHVLALLLLILGLSALFKGAGVFETFKGIYCLLKISYSTGCHFICIHNLLIMHYINVARRRNLKSRPI